MTPNQRTFDDPLSTMADAKPLDDAVSAPIDQADRRKWQFSLRAMMIFTTTVAGVVWLVSIKGVGVLVVVAGLAASTLNSRGALAAWQRPDRCGRPVKLGWLLLVVSLFLPSARGCNNHGMLGWEVAVLCAEAQIDDITNGLDDKKEGLNYVLITLMNLTNLLLLASPLLLALWKRGAGQGYAAALACGATAAWTWPVPDASGVLIGYYVWCLGQLMVLTAARLGPRRLAAMATVAIVRVFFWPEP